MIEHSPDISALAAAMYAAQQKLAGVKKDSTNPHYRNRYASLEAVIEAARGPLNEANIWFTQAPGRMVDGSLEITTMLTHAKSGQWLRSTLHVPLAKTDPQGAGSAITYGCRYALMAALGLPPVDDDAETAVAPARPTNGAAKKAPPIPSEEEKQAFKKVCWNRIKSGQYTGQELVDWWKDKDHQASVYKYLLPAEINELKEALIALRDRPSDVLAGG